MKKIIKNKCIECGSEFESTSLRSKFCSIKCQTEYRRVKKLLKGVENEDYIICKWDNKPVGKYISEHIKKFHSDRTIEEYQNEFPNALIIAPNYKSKISKNSGKHMKTEKYKKMFSEKIKGHKNPNHSSNTTKLQRQLCSKYSKEYWKANYPELTDIEIDKKVTQFALESQKNRLTETQLEYWFNKGYSEEEAKERLKERQTTFSKDICIEKYGEVEGLKRWSTRNSEWSKNMEIMYNSGQYERAPLSLNSSQHSIICNKFIEDILIHIDLTYTKSFKNGELLIKNENNKSRLYDFTYLPTKKIIEFHGDYWHCNPKLYESTYYHKIKNMTAQQIWDYDKEKIDLAKQNGYDVLVIWENNYRKNPDEQLKKCTQFLND